MTTDTTKQHNVLMDVSFYRKRISQIQEHLVAHHLDGLLLLNPNNIMWATGFFHIPSERPIGCYFLIDGDPVFFVPFLEKEHAEGNELGVVRHYWEYPGEIPAEVWMVQEISAARLAVDTASHRTFLRMQEIAPALRLDSGVTMMRYLKSEEELALIEKAAGYADFALSVARRAVTERLHEGISEIDVVQVVKDGPDKDDNEYKTKGQQSLDPEEGLQKMAASIGREHAYYRPGK